MSDVSAEIPDWIREKPSRYWDPGKRLLLTIRKYQALDKSGGVFSKILQKYWVLSYRFWSVVCGAEIDLRCQIGGGFMMPHPNGIVIHPSAVIGPNCMIFQQVTIAVAEDGAPIIGGHVDIGAGAKILGNITLGNHSRVGANAVVLQDVEPNDTVVGIPAKSIHAKSN